MSDKFGNSSDSATSPARLTFDITPHATNALPAVTKGIYVGGGGDITLRSIDGAADTLFKAVPQGTILDVRASHVRAGAGTTASFLVGLA